MTLEAIRSEMTIIKSIRKTDINDARERWLALKIRIEAHIKAQGLPEIWSKILLEEIKKI